MLPDGDDGKRLLVLERLMLPFFVRLAIEREIPLELDNRAGRAEQVAAAADVRLPRGWNVEVHGRGIEDRRRHLRRHEPLPDELIKFELIGRQMTLDQLRAARRIRRANALVRVLCILLVRAVKLRPGGEKLLTKQRSEMIARLTGCHFRHARRVRSHISDETRRALFAHLYSLIEILGHTHRALGSE